MNEKILGSRRVVNGFGTWNFKCSSSVLVSFHALSHGNTLKIVRKLNSKASQLTEQTLRTVSEQIWDRHAKQF